MLMMRLGGRGRFMLRGSREIEAVYEWPFLAQNNMLTEKFAKILRSSRIVLIAMVVRAMRTVRGTNATFINASSFLLSKLLRWRCSVSVSIR
jgi:hypothetical protein